MRKYITYILIVFFLLSPIAVIPSSANAMGPIPNPYTPGQNYSLTDPSSVKKTQDTADPADLDCGITGDSSWSECFQFGLAWIAYYALYGTGWFLGLAGWLLDEAIRFSVVSMSKNVDEFSAINYGWSLIRDLGNFIFIFSLLYVAITTILGMAGSGTMKIIRNIIIVGLLVNFSLFFTKLLIDASNIASLVFYEQFVAKSSAADGTLSITSMSTKVAGFIKLGSIFSDSNGAVAEIFKKDWAGILTVGIGGSIFFISAAITFLYAALLFMLRFLILILLMILSPIGFLGFMLPQTSGLAKKWWNRLLAQLAFAPIYMMLIALAFLLASGMEKIYPLGKDGLAGALALNPAEQPVPAVGGGGGTIGPIINFIVIIGFINAAAIIATAVATNTAGFAGGMRDRSMSFLRNSARATGRGARFAAQKTARGAAGIPIGAAGGIARNTIGRSAYNTLQRERSTLETLAKAGDLKAKKRLETLEARASSGYDLRNVGGLSKYLGGGNTGGYKAKREAKIARTDERIGRVGKVSKETRSEINTSRSRLEDHKKAFRAAAANNDPRGMEKADRLIKEEEKVLARHERAAAAQIREQQARKAAKIANRPLALPVSIPGISASSGARDAAQRFVETRRRAGRTDEEKLDLGGDKIKEVLAGLRGIPPLPGSEPEIDLIKAIKSIPNNQIANLDKDLLIDSRVSTRLKVDQLKELTKSDKLLPADIRAIVEPILKNKRMNPTDPIPPAVAVPPAESATVGFNYVNKMKDDNPWVGITRQVKQDLVNQGFLFP